MQLLHAFGVHWSLLLAQAVNFVILLVVLNKFVYGPVLKVIDQRRKLARETVEKAKEIDHLRQSMEREHKDVLRKADEEAGAILQRAKAEAEALRKETEEQAHHKAEQIMAAGMRRLEGERANVLAELQGTLSKLIVLSTEKIIRRALTDDDQKRLVTHLQDSLPDALSS